VVPIEGFAAPAAPSARLAAFSSALIGLRYQGLLGLASHTLDRGIHRRTSDQDH
jgi:hypothetical protein